MTTRKPRAKTPPAEKEVRISISFPPALLTEIKASAMRNGLRYQTHIKSILTRALRAERSE